ncbi:hypothetical protein [Salmonella enterica]|uniref:hypothetical protein n=1 Tax=Salmonella enterica TaxID=28901 RepID=UPI002FFB973E
MKFTSKNRCTWFDNSSLKNGENTGFEHDDDFGYSFQYDAAAVGKSSFFDEAAGRK